MKNKMGCMKISNLLFISIVLLCYGILGSFGLSSRRGIRVLKIEKRYGNDIYPVKIQTEQIRPKSVLSKTDRFLTTRSDESDITGKRSDTNNGVWFGPRLGRSLHRNEDEPIWIAVDEFPAEQNRHSNTGSTMTEEESAEDIELQ